MSPALTKRAWPPLTVPPVWNEQSKMGVIAELGATGAVMYGVPEYDVVEPTVRVNAK